MQPGSDRVAWARAALSAMPLHFIEEPAASSASATYAVHGRDVAVELREGGLTFLLTQPSPAGAAAPDERDGRRRTRAAVALDFVAGRAGAAPAGRDVTGAVVSEFRGPRERWRTGLATYREVVYPDVWPGIDVLANGSGGRMEYRFVVRPGGDPRRIRLRYRGAESVALDAGGGLDVRTAGGGLREEPPRAFQERRNGGDDAVAAAYTLVREGCDFVYGFRLGRFDPERTLVIDPLVIAYSGFIGAADAEVALAVAVDAAGNAYVAGVVEGTGAFPAVVGPDLSFNGGFDDALVAKVRADGTGLVYAGYIGGDNRDLANGIAVDPSGNAYVVGETDSSEATFPVLGGPDLTYRGLTDGFIAKVAADGTRLEYAGYLGGRCNDRALAVAVDAAGRAYVAGRTCGSTFDGFPAVVGPDLSPNGSDEAFVARLRSDGSGFEYAGFIGGDDSDGAAGIAIDAAGAAYVAGRTKSSPATFPAAVGPRLTHSGLGDAFVAKVRPDGSGLEYAGYVGGDAEDEATAVAVDAAGAAYLSGTTHSTETTFPVAVGPDLSFNGGGNDAFVAKVRPDGTGLEYAGYIGGTGRDEGHGIAVDAAGRAHVVGETWSGRDFPLAGAVGRRFGGLYDAFLARVAPDGSRLLSSGFLGGGDEDPCTGVAVDASGAAYVAGHTVSSDFPVVVGPDLTLDSYDDAFIVKVALAACIRAALAPPAALVGVKRGRGAEFAWELDPAADEFHLNVVTAKDVLRESDPTSPRQRPVGLGETRCVASLPGCLDPTAIDDVRSLLFYQVLSACGPAGGDEGPVCSPSAPCP